MVITALASGCAGETAARPHDVDLTVRLPLHEYRLSDAEEAVVNTARRELVRTCMRRAGFPRHVPDLPDATGPERVSAAYQRRYGVTDDAEARQWGYHLPRDPVAAARHAAADRRRRALPRAERLALGGRSGSNGCVGWANRRLRTGVVPGDARLVSKVDFDSFDASRADPRLRRPLAEWSRCMAEHGFRFSDPLAALAGGWDLDSAQPSRREIEAATADIDCKRRTDLVRAWVEVEADIQTKAIAAQREAFAKIIAAKKAYLANAVRFARG